MTVLIEFSKSKNIARNIRVTFPINQSNTLTCAQLYNLNEFILAQRPDPLPEVLAFVEELIVALRG